MNNRNRRSWAASGLALVALMIMPTITVAESRKSFPPGRVIDEFVFSCSEFDLVVFSDVEDIFLDFGQSGWVVVDDPEVEMFCGDFETTIECPFRTNYVRVSRTAKWSTTVQCYRD